MSTIFSAVLAVIVSYIVLAIIHYAKHENETINQSFPSYWETHRPENGFWDLKFDETPFPESEPNNYPEMSDQELEKQLRISLRYDI